MLLGGWEWFWIGGDVPMYTAVSLRDLGKNADRLPLSPIHQIYIYNTSVIWNSSNNLCCFKNIFYIWTQWRGFSATLEKTKKILAPSYPSKESAETPICILASVNFAHYTQVLGCQSGVNSLFSFSPYLYWLFCTASFARFPATTLLHVTFSWQLYSD